MRHRLRGLHRFTNGRGRAGDDFPAKRRVHARAAEAVFCQKLFGCEIAAHAVVLMQRVHCHAIHCCPRRLCQSAPPLIMTAIADAKPVHRAQHHRLALSHHHHA